MRQSRSWISYQRFVFHLIFQKFKNHQWVNCLGHIVLSWGCALCSAGQAGSGADSSRKGLFSSAHCHRTILTSHLHSAFHLSSLQENTPGEPADLFWENEYPSSIPEHRQGEQQSSEVVGPATKNQTSAFEDALRRVCHVQESF